MVAPRFSIIIPARNDDAVLGQMPVHLVRPSGIESAQIIVAASDDPDGTTHAVAGRTQLLCGDDSTRAARMNAGAAVASGEILFFLHADSVSPSDALKRVDEVLTDGRVVGGAFEHLATRRICPTWT